jgi:hypothetical protein
MPDGHSTGGICVVSPALSAGVERKALRDAGARGEILERPPMPGGLDLSSTKNDRQGDLHGFLGLANVRP